MCSPKSQREDRKVLELTDGFPLVRYCNNTVRQLYNEEQKLLVVFIIHILARPAQVLGYCRKHATASSYYQLDTNL